jgi:hypothetical protein
MEYKGNFGGGKIHISETPSDAAFRRGESRKGRFPKVLKTPKLELLINQGYGRIIPIKSNSKAALGIEHG